MHKRWTVFALAAALTIACMGAAPAGNPSPEPDAGGCGVTGGTLTMLSADNDSEFAAFALLDAQGRQLAQQFIPTYSQDASAELMMMPIGFSTEVATVKCLADSSVRRCADPAWPPLETGVGISIAGVLLAPDWAIVSIKGRYVNVASPIAGSIDGASLGFQLDDDPIRWSSLYDSQTEASQAFFGIKPGDHRITLGSRDAATGSFLAQDRLCFNA
jgi:hypothetical protein